MAVGWTVARILMDSCNSDHMGARGCGVFWRVCVWYVTGLRSGVVGWFFCMFTLYCRFTPCRNTKLEQMIVAASTLAAEMDFVEVHSDSRLAIMAALGIPRKTKNKRRQPRGQQSGGTNGVNDALATRAREAPLHERGKSCMGA